MKTILVTGGCGYIGRNMVKSLLKKGYEVVVVDSLINASREAIISETKFYQADIRDYKEISKIFKENKIEIVMDFAALLDVEESWEIPMEYHDVNVNGLNVILKCMKENDVKNIIFSSTAAVYESTSELLDENSLINPTNPYGMSKLTAERFMEYYSQKEGLNYVTFRYFNVIGSNKVGYDWSEFSTVVPKIISSLQGGSQFVINGNDYDTKDGTCVRDYIHMEDLISAHQGVVDNFESTKNNVYNLSIGNGTTIIELVDEIKNAFGIDVEYEFGPRRKGDIVVSVASNKKILSVIPWDIKYGNIKQMIEQIKLENTIRNK